MNMDEKNKHIAELEEKNKIIRMKQRNIDELKLIIEIAKIVNVDKRNLSIGYNEIIIQHMENIVKIKSIDFIWFHKYWTKTYNIVTGE